MIRLWAFYYKCFSIYYQLEDSEGLRGLTRRQWKRREGYFIFMQKTYSSLQMTVQSYLSKAHWSKMKANHLSLFGIPPSQLFHSIGVIIVYFLNYKYCLSLLLQNGEGQICKMHGFYTLTSSSTRQILKNHQLSRSGSFVHKFKYKKHANSPKNCY